MKSRQFACILAGGSGERFWPMSRVRTPKHLLKLFSDRTLIEETARRLDGVLPPENIFVLTNEAQLEGVRAALPFVPPSQIVAEPLRRDTAPAAALATALVRARDPDGVVALLPADAFIRDSGRFAAQLKVAFDLASGRGWACPDPVLLTFAVKPTFPSTGFGYLELGDPITAEPASGEFRKVVRFVEKPDAATAKSYVDGGRYAWNAGMFLWRTGDFLKEAERLEPALGRFIREFPSSGADSYIASRFPALPKISVDYAILEKARAVVTLVAQFDWDDVGAWTALPKHLPLDPSGNSVRGPVVAADAGGNIAVSNGRLIALCGVNDLVVVETADAVLVCHRDSVQDLKKLQPLLPKDLV
ncbi:MAG: sugar phosphate nucleotidyltransferase [Opitutaceae bacterium]|jgi:mannose-1-phosphate guanylyltransferase